MKEIETMDKSETCSVHVSNLTDEEIAQPGKKTHTCVTCGFRWMTESGAYVGYDKDDHGTPTVAGRVAKSKLLSDLDLDAEREEMERSLFGEQTTRVDEACNIIRAFTAYLKEMKKQKDKATQGT